MNESPYTVHQRTDGRWEVRCALTSPPHAVGATSYHSEGDAEFICGHLNAAFISGARSGLALAQESVPGGDAISERLQAMEIASRIVHPDVHEPGLTKADEVISTAKDLLRYAYEG